MMALFASLFPIMSSFQPSLSSELYQAMAGLLLGGIAALSRALLTDGRERWRQGGLRAMEQTPTLRFMKLALVYPSLTAMSVIVWWVSATGRDLGIHYAVGMLMAGTVMGWRASVALAGKRAIAP